MKKDVAAKMLKAVLALDAPIGELDGLVSRLDDGEEKKECIRALGEVMGIIAEHFFFRVVRQYPELDPDPNASGRPP